MKRFFFLAAFLAATAVTAANVKLDSTHSKVEFTVVHMMISNVTGRFDKIEGAAVIDEKANQLKSMTVTVQTASINTNVEKRDGHLKSADFFDADKFPQITFKVDKPVTLRKGAAVPVTGVLT
ncbi:MAG: YceI family protein, partial [Spirochaetia bacterium]|nr:YceI family protein [Spirochaetia bacterium]